MKYFKIIALTVLCMGFVSVYAQQKAGDLPERDTGPVTVQKDRATDNPNDPPSGQATEATMVTSIQATEVDMGIAGKEKQINPELDPNVPPTGLPEPARTAVPNPGQQAQQGSSPNDDPNAIEPIDK